MTFDIITLFPDMFKGPFDQSIVKRARDKKLVEINLHDLRKWAIDERGTVDDRPYGGGIGMVLRIEPIYKALKDINVIPANAGIYKNRSRVKPGMTKVILMDPRGVKFTQAKAREYSKLDRLVLVCGHYEGVDERVKNHLIDESVSVGDYVLTGGEIPAMIITDAVTRLIPGVLSKPEAIQNESFSDNSQFSILNSQFEHPQYTRPDDFNGWKVPEVLLNGNHKEIEKWRGAKH